MSDFNGATQVAAQATNALPGSEAKVAVLAERARLGLSLRHPGDATLESAPCAVGVA